jgi:hypothetical protein
VTGRVGCVCERLGVLKSAGESVCECARLCSRERESAPASTCGSDWESVRESGWERNFETALEHV